MRNTKISSTHIVVLLVVLVLLGTLLYIGTNLPVPNKYTHPIKETSSLAEPTIIPVIQKSPRPGWNIYTILDYKLSFDYPDDENNLTISSGITSRQYSNSLFLLDFDRHPTSMYPTTKTAKEFYDQRSIQLYNEPTHWGTLIKEYMIGSSAAALYHNANSTNPTKYVLVIHEGYAYEFATTFAGKSNDEVLASIRFID